MNKDLLVKVSVEWDEEFKEWDLTVFSPVQIRNEFNFYICSYKTKAGAIKAAKRLLPLFVNAVLEE